MSTEVHKPTEPTHQTTTPPYDVEPDLSDKMATITLISVSATIVLIFVAMIFAGTLYSSHLTKVKDELGGLNENSAAFAARQSDKKKSESIPKADAVDKNPAILQGSAKDSKADVGAGSLGDAPSYDEVLNPGAQAQKDEAGDDNAPKADDADDADQDAADADDENSDSDADAEEAKED